MAGASLSVLIPLYNEEEFIQELLARVVAAPLPPGMDRELVVVDDCSKDGSIESVQAFMASHPEVRLNLVRHEKNRGKGAAIRTAIQHATGHYCVIQDADLEYDPQEYPKLLGPLVSGQADVVYGSRFLITGERRVLYYWHSLANHFLTTLCNIVADINLTDMETCYKAFRTSFIKTIPLFSDRFGMEPELTVKFARRKARIFETSISYYGRTYEEGKKIGLKDAFEALWVILKARFTSRLYNHPAHAALDALSVAPKFNAWMAETLAPYVGKTVLEIGAGNGNMTRHLCKRKPVYIATDINADYVELLRGLFRHRPSVLACELDAAKPEDFAPHAGKVDTVVCVNVLENIEDDTAALKNMRDVLAPGGRLILLVPAGPDAFGTLDEVLAHRRRYSKEDLERKLAASGFDVEKILPFNRVSRPAWKFSGQVLKSRAFSRTSLLVFNRLVWLWKMVDGKLPWAPASLIFVGRRRD